MHEKPADMIIVGAGLSGLLTAWRCLDVNPELCVMVIEASDHIAGDHTWSFNLTDVAEELRDWIQPFIAYQWDRYDVKFPKRERTLEIPYCTGNSDTLRACVQPHIESGRLRLMLNTQVSELTSESVTLKNDEVLEAACVLDARGFEPRGDEIPGWQKFVGRVIKTEKPHGLHHPVIMDATVEQIDGYRFLYLLPFSDTELLVEDTYFSDTSNLSENEISARIDDYIKDKGWSDHKVLRTEKGVLPMMMATDRDDDSSKIGLAGGFAVAATGFTVPCAVEIANKVAQTIRSEGIIALNVYVPKLRSEHIARERYPRLLNRMFFRAAEPQKRFIILQRFYGFKEGLIKRFYRNGLTRRDKARILIGKPPVPVSKALYNFSEKAFIKRERAARKQNQ
ncbi:lycopene beta-cyclase CrtY [Litorimonas sp. RW-G-Af-16]